MKRGFTLIELLIVVAIIAILAAIAIPNFLAAQTRSKVSSVRANFTTLATGLESYYVDNNEYIPAWNEDELRWYYPWERLTRLTTPIAYLSSFPKDVFENNDATNWTYWGGYYWYEDRKSTKEYWQTYIPRIAARTQIQYVIISKGPNLLDDFWVPSPSQVREYDPTNGIISIGDLRYWGPGNIPTAALIPSF